MAKKKSYNFIVSLVLYPFDVMFSFAETDEQLLKTMKKVTSDGDWDEITESIKFSHPKQHAFTVIFTNGYTLIRMRKLPDNPDLVGILSHECFHAISGIMDRIGMPLQFGVSEEGYAYGIGYLVSKALEPLN